MTTFMSMDPDEPKQLVVVYPGELAVMDNMYNDIWIELEIIHLQVSEFFASLK